MIPVIVSESTQNTLWTRAARSALTSAAATARPYRKSRLKSALPPASANGVIDVAASLHSLQIRSFFERTCCTLGVADRSQTTT